MRLWGRDRERLAAMAQARRNERYLPSAQFPDSLAVEASLPAALAGAFRVTVALPGLTAQACAVGRTGRLTFVK